ncbi:HMG domain-containing protein 4 isoform X2 [Oryzias melastigma]|uniref:HMG domain-containing protein 4 isoform X2 n=1 Tax=Oryzias melastigma TaxID=30732 RepID=UPI000CF80701|nr:HMG domain-containing protein 4 isoform X2 [Oryzias melastigma]
MDGETDSDGPRENQKDITMEVENLLVEAKNSGTKGLQEKLDDSKKQHNGRTDAELQWSDSSGSLSAHAVYVFSDEWTMRREEEMNTTSLLENWACPDREGHRDPAESLSMPLVLSRSDLSDLYTQAGLAVPNLSSKPSSPIASSRFVTSPTTDALKFASRRSSGDPVSAAAHLHLLGESLSLIGQHLQETNKMVCLSSSFSLLLDSMLCALAPLMSLTSQIPELSGCTDCTLASSLENFAYLMPGL